MFLSGNEVSVMERSIMNGFGELNYEEMIQLDAGKVTAGGIFDAACKGATAGAAGCIVASFFPAGAPAYMACAVTAGVVTYIWDNV